MTSWIGRPVALLTTSVPAAVLAVAAVVLMAAPTQASEEWLTNYDEALAESTRSGKPVFVLFTGSDWCPHCRTL